MDIKMIKNKNYETNMIKRYELAICEMKIKIWML